MSTPARAYASLIAEGRAVGARIRNRLSNHDHGRSTASVHPEESMQVHVSNDAPTSVATGALVVPVFAGGAVDGVAAEVDKLLGGAIADILAGGEISGKANETSLVHAKDAPFKRVLVVGLGDRATFNASALAKYAGTAVRYLGKRGVASIAIALPADVDAAQAASVGA